MYIYWEILRVNGYDSPLCVCPLLLSPSSCSALSLFVSLFGESMLLLSFFSFFFMTFWCYFCLSLSLCLSVLCLSFSVYLLLYLCLSFISLSFCLSFYDYLFVIVEGLI